MCWQQGQRAWPGLDVPVDTFFEALGRCCQAAEDLDDLAIGDLFLAAACTRGCQDAVRALLEHVGDVLDSALTRLGLSNDEIADVRMTVVQRLVVDDPPRISRYGGRGPLSQWVAVVAAREAKDRRRTAARRRGLLEVAHTAIAPEDPELGFLKAHYRAQFAEAFRDALGALGPRDRTLLEYRFVDGLTLDELARACGVHRATAARWLARIRGELLEATRSTLQTRFGVNPAELDSIVGLIASNFGISVRRLLKS